MRRFVPLLALLHLAGCSCSSLPPVGASCAGASDCETGEACVEGLCREPTGETGADGGEGTVDAGREWDQLAIRPASTELTCRLGQPCGVDLTAEGLFADGSRIEVNASWSLDRHELASIDPRTGKLTASGLAPGRVQVEAAAGGRTAKAEITIRLSDETVTAEVPPNPSQHFLTPGTDAARAPAIVYPYDQVVMPANVAPPLLQWSRGHGNDLYRITFRSELTSVTVWSVGDRYKLADEQWRVLAAGAAGDGIAVTVDAANSADAGGSYFSSAPVTINVAQADFAGQIYYWALSIKGGPGGLVRIGSDYQLDDFWQPPAPGAPGSRACVACHNLSFDGQRLSFTFDAGGGNGGIVDVSAPEPNVVGRGRFSSNFTVFDSTGEYVVASIGRQLNLHDAGSGQLVQGALFGGPHPALGAAFPRFSPDGRHFAFTRFPDNSWEIDYTSSDLFLADVTYDPSGVPTIANDRKLDTGVQIPPSSPALSALAYPSFSPDSKLLAYSRGQHSRSGFDDQGIVYQSRLLLQDLAAPGTVTHLQALADASSRDYSPAFSPFKSGGYYWLAFMSRRDYGHLLKGVQRRQIWIAAIDENFVPGKDPSHPAFWLPGQDESTENMTAYWAPAACKQTKEDGACRADLECCAGKVCRPDGSGKSFCTPVEGACRPSGATCDGDAQCCPGLRCRPSSEGNRCQSQLG